MKPNIQRDIIIQSSSSCSRRPTEHNVVLCVLSLFSPSDINHKSSRDTSLSQLYYTSCWPPGPINLSDQFKLILINVNKNTARNSEQKWRIWNALQLIDDNCYVWWAAPAVAYLFLFSFLTFWLIVDCPEFLGGFILLTLLYLVNKDLAGSTVNSHHSYYRAAKHSGLEG